MTVERPNSKNNFAAGVDFGGLSRDCATLFRAIFKTVPSDSELAHQIQTLETLDMEIYG